MKKSTFIIGLLLLSYCVAMADGISETQAKAIAQRFITGNVTMSKGMNATSSTLSTAHTSTGYYAFNRGNDGGFIIVAADDRALDMVLGYADSGTFDTGNMPANMKAWLDGYDREMAYLAANSSTFTLKKTIASAEERANIAPLITSSWGQETPYYFDCPLDAEGKHCFTGCVATAMAQIMYYYKWPERGIGSHSYVWNNQTIAMDFSQRAYDWANMTDTYSNESTEAQQKAVAQLMADVGCAVEMKYSSSVSLAYGGGAFKALYENFGYDKGMEFVERDFYTDEEWQNMMYYELAQERPILYLGTSLMLGGHAFILDGYKDGYYHFNWGWNGINDGYFKINALYGDGAEGYNFFQQALVGIKKAEEGSSLNHKYYAQNLFTDDNNTSVTFADDVVLSFNSLYSYCMEPQKMNLGIIVTAEDGTETIIPEYRYSGEEDSFFQISRTIPAYITTITVQMETFPSKEGEYVVTVYQEEESGVKHNVMVKRDRNPYCIAEVSGNTITFSPANVSSNLTAVKIEPLTTPRAGQPFMVSVTVSNTGCEYKGLLYLAVKKDVDGQLQIARYSKDTQVISLPGDASTDLSFSVIAPDEPGQYIMGITTNGEDSYDNLQTITVEETSSVGKLEWEVNSVHIDNPTAREDMTVDVALTCKSGGYCGPIHASVYVEGNENSLTRLTSGCIGLAEGDTYTVHLRGDIDGVTQPGKEYYLRLFYNVTDAEYITTRVAIDSLKYPFTTAADATVINSVNADDSTPTLIYSDSGVSLGQRPVSTLPSDLYIMKKGQTTRKILVK